MSAAPIPIEEARARRAAREQGPEVHAEPAPSVPASPAIEAAFLFSLMSPDLATPELKTALELLSPEHLFNASNGHVLRAMKSLAARGHTIEPALVLEELRGSPAPVRGWGRYIAETLPAQAAHAQAPPTEYAKILVEKWRQRQAIKTYEAAISATRKGETFESAASQTRDGLAAIAEVNADPETMPATTTLDGVRDVWTTITAATDHGRPLGVSWGFEVLDDQIGRMQQPAYIVIGGRSGQGKTQIAWQTGLNLGTRPTDRALAQWKLEEFEKKNAWRIGEAQAQEAIESLRREAQEASDMHEGTYYASFEMARSKLLLRGICVEANYPQKLVLKGIIPQKRDPSKDGARCPGCATEYSGEQWMSLPTNARGERVCRVCAGRERSVETAGVPEAMASPHERLVIASNLVSSAPIFIDDKPCPPRELADRFKRVRDLAAEGKMKTRGGQAYPKTIVRTIVVDSIQDTPPPPGPTNRNRTTEIQDTSRALLNGLAKECGITVIGLAKLTRAVDKQKDRRPQLADIRECGDIEYQADEIFFVHREQYYLREKTPWELRNIADIVHGKGRAGLDLDSPPPRMWFAGGMFFDAPPDGWEAWELRHVKGQS